MERRDVLRALGAATAITLLPRTAHAAWDIVNAEPGAPMVSLTDERAALVAALADTIIPRTDTPSATDVGVPAFVDVIVTKYYNDEERTSFLAGLDAIGVHVKTSGATSLGTMVPNARSALLDALDKLAERRAPGASMWSKILALEIFTTAEARSWVRLKGLVIHGYFTSERVQKEVLKKEIMPGRFDGNAPMKPVAGASHG